MLGFQSSTQISPKLQDDPMSKKPSYYEQLKHPKWQEKRLKVLEREGFTCQWCGSDETTLHAHHTYYEKNAAPWEYPDNSLLCLCETCHKEAHAIGDEIKRMLGVVLALDQGLASSKVKGYVKAMQVAHAMDMDEEYGAAWLTIDDQVEAEGVADYFKIGSRWLWARVSINIESGKGSGVDARMLVEAAGIMRTMRAALDDTAITMSALGRPE